MAQVSSLLSITPSPTIALLAIKHSTHPSTAAAAAAILTAYATRLTADTPPAQRALLSNALSRPAVVVVAFWLAWSKTEASGRGKVEERRQLQQDWGVAEKEWKAVSSSISAHCAHLLGKEEVQRRRAKRQRQELEEEAGDVDVDEQLAGEELDAERVQDVSSLVGTKTAAYAQWRQRVMEDESRERLEAESAAQHDGGDVDDQTDSADDDEATRPKPRRGLKQSRLSFAPVSPQAGDAGGRKRRKGGYSDAVVL